MMIRTQLNVSTIVLLVTAGLIAITLLLVSRQVNHTIAKNRAVDEIVAGVFELNLLTHEYITHQSDRAHTQWHLKYADLDRRLATTVFDHENEEDILVRLQNEFVAIGSLFARLSRLTQRSGNGAQPRRGDATLERLSTQITIGSQAMMSDALALGDIAESKILIVKRNVTLLGAIFVIMLGGQLLTMITLVGRRVMRPMAMLSDGAREVADGNLDYRVKISSKDEMAQYALTFNAMTERLQSFFDKVRFEVHERHEVERKLATETEELRVTLDSLGDAVITTGADRTIRVMNPVAEHLTGWSRSEAEGEDLERVLNLVPPHAEIRASDDADSDKRQTPPVPSTPHMILRDRDGDERRVARQESPIADERGLHGYVVIFRDVSEQLAIEQESMRIQKLESVGVLAGGIAHDFNNILTAILGSLSLATFDLEPDSSVHELIKEAENASMRAKKLTQQLLTFSKGGAPVKQSARLEELIRESTNFALRGSNVTCDFLLANDLWSAEVDSGQFSQVIQNLVINAKQAMPEGGRVRIQAENAELEAHSRHPLPQGPYVKITVSDQGPGIPPGQLDKIFDPYYSTKETGSGLGLAIIHSIIVNHSGHINVESRVGIGTKFNILLPASGTRDVLALEFEHVEPEAPKVGRGNILIMDDERVVARIAGRMLNRLGYSYQLAMTGEHAIELFLDAQSAKRPFDIVILDLTVRGGMGGKEVCRLLHEIDPSVKALVSSGYSNDAIMANYRDHGFKGVIEKPYKFDTLKDTIQKFVAST